jgi:replicative DNA helicase
MHPGQLIVPAGRTSMGKSTFALNVVRHACVECGIPTLVFTAEMSAAEITKNLVSSVACVATHKVHSPRFLSPQERADVEAAIDKVGNAPLEIYDAPPLDVPTIRSHARRGRVRRDLGLVVVDYLQLLDPSGLGSLTRSSTREQQVTAMSRGLKSIARELGVPVLAISQLNRMPEAREDHRPRISDMRESGSVENDADVILLLYRADYYARDEAERQRLRGQAEIIVAKQRNGPTATVPVVYRTEIARFSDLAPAHFEEPR